MEMTSPDLNRRRGSGNQRFPVAEVLEPMGSREPASAGDVKIWEVAQLLGCFGRWYNGSMQKGPDMFSGELFETGQNPERAEVLQPALEGKPGDMVDKDGNVYDAKGLKREKQSPHLERALALVRKMHPHEADMIGPDDGEVQHYLRKFKREAGEL